MPDPQVALAMLRGTSIPLELVAYVLTTVAWLMWAWLTLSLLLRLVVNVADVLARGAAWVASLRRVSNALTLPFVRRAVDGALAAAMVVQVVAHGAPVASAQPLEPTPMVQMVNATTKAEAVRTASYTVQSGDTLWTIAERFYGTGHEYPRLVEANVGRTVLDGTVFPETGVIEPGWQLRVPMPSTTLDDEDGEAVYTVERGDTLWGISARFLGDPLRWPEIYEANRESASLADGRTLRNPNLIWPELKLKLPLAVEAAQPAAGAETVEVPAAAGATVEAPSNGHVQAAAQESNGMAMAAGGAAASLGAAGAVAAGLLVRRRGRRSLDEPPLGNEPESDYVVRGGFADLEDLSRRLDSPEAVAAQEVLRYYDERGMRGSVGLVSVRHGRSSTTLALVSQRLSDRPKLMDMAGGLASRLGIEVSAQLSRDHDVLLRLASVRRARFGTGAGAKLLPIGVLADRRVLSLNWQAVGHMLVAGRGRGALSSLLSTMCAELAVRVRREELHMLAFARPRALAAPLERLPHQVGAFVDPTDHLATTAAMHDVRAELLRRMERVERGGLATTLPDLVVIVPELELAIEHLSTLEMIGAYGPAHRVRLLAASSRSQDLPDRLIAHFSSRAVVRLPDERESTRLLGSAGATELLGGGQLLLRVDEREPVEVYGFRVAELELERAVRMVRGEPVDVAVRSAARAEPEWSDDAEDDEPIVASGQVLDLSPRSGGPAVEVRCFGGFDVVAGQDDLTAAGSPSEAAERAGAWELLAFLSCQPEGLASREDVFAALWPSADGRRAAAALTGTIERLNGLLADAVRHIDATAPPVRLDTRDGTVRVDLQRVESDVHRFARLCHAAALMPIDRALETWERARQLYRGDLLDGPGARAYGWVTMAAQDGELSLREQNREQYYRATLRQARALARSGRDEDAIPLFQELLQVEPLLEDVVRDLYRCYAATGDLDGLVEEERRLRSALRQAPGPEDDPDPEPATAALFTELRTDLEMRASVVTA